LDLLETQIIPYLKGSRLWPYISGSFPNLSHRTQQTNEMEEVDAQALFTILMNIVPNIQAGLAPQQRMHGMDY